MQTFFDIVIFVTGFGVCWSTKDAIVQRVAGSEALLRSLEARIAALRAKL